MSRGRNIAVHIVDPANLPVSKEPPWEVTFYERVGPVEVGEDPLAKRAARVRNKAERTVRVHNQD